MTTTELRPADDYTVGDLVDIDPRQLLIGTNARETVVLDDAFVASIKENGVLQPIHAYVTDGGLTVEYGQRRTLGAVKAKRKTVPVIVVAPPSDRDRVTHQLVENIHRAGMTATEVAKGVEQLALLGVSDAQIVKRTALPKEQVVAARAAGKSATALAAATTPAAGDEEPPDLTLEHMAAIAEFDGTDQSEQAVQRIVQVARRGGDVAFTVQRLRDEAAQKAAEDELRAERRMVGGLVVLDAKPPYDGPAKRLASLRQDDSYESGTAIDEAEHGATCPGHAEYVDTESVWEGRNREEVTRAIAICQDWKGHGHADLHGRAKVQPTAEELAAAAQAKTWNKDWKTTVTVRRDWLFAFVARKTPPAGAEAFVLRELLHRDSSITDAVLGYTNNTGAASWRAFRDVMGLDRGPAGHESMMAQEAEMDELFGQLENLSPKRAMVLLAALILASWHQAATKPRWEHPTAQDDRVLRQMQEWGYPLTDVEVETLARFQMQQEERARKAEVSAAERARAAAEGDAVVDEEGYEVEDPEELARLAAGHVAAEEPTPGSVSLDDLTISNAEADEMLARNLAGDTVTLTDDHVIVAVVSHGDITDQPEEPAAEPADDPEFWTEHAPSADPVADLA